MLTFALSFIFLNFLVVAGWERIVAAVLFLIKSIGQLLITLAGFVVSLKVS